MTGFDYAGRVYVRPLGRGVVLLDLPGGPHLDDLLAEGIHDGTVRLDRLDSGEGWTQLTLW